MRRNPFHITYTDLIQFAERAVERMEKTYPAMKLHGKISADAATRNMECGKVLLKLLKKYNKNRQLNLNDLFEQMKNNKQNGNNNIKSQYNSSGRA